MMLVGVLSICAGSYFVVGLRFRGDRHKVSEYYIVAVMIFRDCLKLTLRKSLLRL